MTKSLEEINQRITEKRATVLTAEEMTRLVAEEGPEEAARKVDVVTTGTFGAMCSSGLLLNFGHADPPIRMTKVFLNGVEAHAGLAAVDAYLGATQEAPGKSPVYGGAHVIEDLLLGRRITLEASSQGTDCYPRKEIVTSFTLEELNQAILFNPRNSYQCYNAAVNGSARTIHTYMGKLLPSFANLTYSGAGELSPLPNDPGYRTIGLGTRIFLGGGIGYVLGSGTQHNPASRFGTLMVKGELRGMKSRFLRAAFFPGYGVSLFVGIGVPIPILDAEMAQVTGVSDDELFTEAIDYSVPRRDKPVVGRFSYRELKSGRVKLLGKTVPASSMSSLPMAREVAQSLKKLISQGGFHLTFPVETLPTSSPTLPLQERPLPECSPRSTIAQGLWNEARCIRCGQCIGICPGKVFSFNPSGVFEVDPSRCLRCGLCLDLCPLEALHPEVIR